MKIYSLWEGLTMENFMENCLSGEGLHTGAGKSVRSPASAEGEKAEITCDQLTVVLRGKKLSPGKRVGGGKVFYDLFFHFS